MSILGHQSLINSKDAFWLSSIANDVIHSTIQVQELDASVGRFSTLFADTFNASTINVSSLSQENADVSGMYVSSIQGNTAFFSTVTLASDLSGGVGYVRFSVDASGIQVDGDPIRFDNIVYLTSTINIVQVSTIVDTDIFAQNGYFSTLSSGIFNSQQNNLSSIVFNDISGNTGTMNQLVVSSIIAGDISGVDLASSWSLYPTLNSSIQFQPAYVLSNVGPNLYFAGVELTDVSGGGQDWSRFPAVSTVQMANNSLTGLSTLQFQDNAKLYSLTGNNLFYNGQQIAYGSAGFASNWAQYTANANVNIGNSTLFGVSLIQGSNMTLFGSNITNGNTFTGSLGVGGTSLLSLATIDSGGDLTCRNIDVGDSVTSLADVNIYGVNALAGDNALYVIGGTTLTGGLTAGVPVHGTEIGALPVAGVDTVRIDVLPVGMGLNSATYIQLACGGAGSFASGGALSLAGGDYVEINTDDLRVINTTSGNQSTTLTVANIQMPASVAASVPLQINNTAGGGINLVGSANVGQIANFSSISGNNFVGNTVQSGLLSTINLNVSTINGVPLSSIQTPANIVCSNINVSFSTVTNALYGNAMNITGNGSINFLLANNGLQISTNIGALQVNNIKIPDNITGVTNAPMPLQSRIENFSSIQSGTMSTGNIRLSSINGVDWNDISGGANVLAVSSIQTSSIGSYGGANLKLVSPLEFMPLSGIDNIDSINFASGFGIPFLNIQASTIGLGTNNAKTDSFSTNQLSTGSLYASLISSVSLGLSSISATRIQTQEVQLSSIESFSGLPVKLTNGISFNGSVGRLDNVIDINQLEAVGTLGIYGASTIRMSTLNTDITGSLSTSQISTTSFAVSSINGNNARVAYTNNLCLSTMDLYQNSTTLVHWSTVTTSSNINTSDYDVVVGTNGVYKFGVSLQLDNTSGTDEVEYFFVKNDVVIDKSATFVTVANNTETTAYTEIIEPMANGDKIQIGLYTTETDVRLSTIGGNVTISPGAILTAYKIV